MRKAFSLMELMIVIIILGILATMVMTNLVGQGERARQKLVCVQMKTISEGLKMFKLELGGYPTMEEGLKALIENPDEEKYKSYPSGGYLDGKKDPKDPWGNPYIYIAEEDENKYELVSLGADGKEGGEKENEDIKFSKCQE